MTKGQVGWIPDRAVRRLRHYKTIDWRRILAAGGIIAAVDLTLAYVPLTFGVAASVTLAPAALILAVLYCGALPTVLAATIAAFVRIWLDVEFNFFTYAASALLTGALLRSRMLPVWALLAYGASVALARFVFTHGGQLSATAWWTVVAFDSIVNVGIAVAIWMLLPRRSSFKLDVRHRRPSVELLAFSWSLSLAVLPWLIALNLPRWMSGAIKGDVARVDIEPIALLCGVGIAIAFSTALSRYVVRSFDSLARHTALSNDAANRPARRANLREVPRELASIVLQWRRRSYRLRRTAAERNAQVAELRAENERQRKSLQESAERLQAQTQTLLQVQRRDTVNLKDLEDALREARSTIEQIRRGRNLFVAMMSHEVRTPLHGLMATLSLLREESLSSDGRHQLDIARSSARSLLNIANDILDLSRIETGGFSFEIAPFDPQRLIGVIVEQFQATAQAQNLKIVANVAEEMPETLLGDRNRIQQVISNLVTNALKFTERGGVNIRASWQDKKFVVDVIDTGKGVPPEMRKMIFDSFVQGESSPSRRSAGTGLGLTIGRHLAKAMGGALTLQTTGRHGSVFRLELELEISDEPAPEDISQRILAHPTGHLLVVEDNEANQYVAKVLLESLGCTVVVIDNGPAAIERVQNEQFDIVLMDCELPGMDGFETTRRMRKVLTKKIPIIAMTANALPEDKARCKEAGMDDFLTKPFNKATLSRYLGHWLAEEQNGGAEKTEPVLDVIVFEELWESLQWRTKPLEGIYDAFYKNVRDTMQLLSRLSDAPKPQLLRLLHTVRGSAGMVGAKRIARLTAIIEHAAKNSQITVEMVEAANLRQELQELEAAVMQKLAPYAQGRAG